MNLLIYTEENATFDQNFQVKEGQEVDTQKYTVLWTQVCPFDISYTHNQASLLAQMVKNLPAMWETWVLSLGWENPLEEVMASYSNILAWRIPMDRGAWQTTVHGVTKSQSWLSTKHKASQIYYLTVLWVISLTQFSSGQIQEFKVSTEFILFWSL